jgi:hypothetical protein
MAPGDTGRVRVGKSRIAQAVAHLAIRAGAGARFMNGPSCRPNKSTGRAVPTGNTSGQ